MIVEIQGLKTEKIHEECSGPFGRKSKRERERETGEPLIVFFLKTI